MSPPLEPLKMLGVLLVLVAMVGFCLLVMGGAGDMDATVRPSYSLHSKP